MSWCTAAFVYGCTVCACLTMAILSAWEYMEDVPRHGVENRNREPEILRVDVCGDRMVAPRRCRNALCNIVLCRMFVMLHQCPVANVELWPYVLCFLHL